MCWNPFAATESRESSVRVKELPSGYGCIELHEMFWFSGSMNKLCLFYFESPECDKPVEMRVLTFLIKILSSSTCRKKFLFLDCWFQCG